jgi:hypothetical protein
MQTGSFGTLIGWKSGQNTYVLLGTEWKERGYGLSTLNGIVDRRWGVLEVNHGTTLVLNNWNILGGKIAFLPASTLPAHSLLSDFSPHQIYWEVACRKGESIFFYSSTIYCPNVGPTGLNIFPKNYGKNDYRIGDKVQIAQE